jgi:predicted SnoaL-like aldol condensation-catalyzing enzyme
MTARDPTAEAAWTSRGGAISRQKQTAVSFLRDAATGRVREAYAAHIAPKFRHHNAFFAGDAKSLMTAMEENARQNPQKALEVKHTLEDGDLVARPSEPG